MADAKLGILLTADGSQLTKTLGALEEQLKRFQTALKNTSNVESFNRINRAIEVTKGRLDALKTSSGAASQAMDKLKSSSNAANNVLINSGRIFQDLPFGIIGIANNINPLIESFQRASAAAKETGTSLTKNLLGSLTGGGGIGLAFSLITGAASFAVTGLAAFTRGMSSSGASADEASVAFELASASLDKISESAKGAVTELQFLNKLGAINIKIAGLGDALDLSAQVTGQQQLIFDLNEDRKKLIAEDKKNTNDEEKTNDEKIKLEQDFFAKLKDVDKQIIDEGKNLIFLRRSLTFQRKQDAEKEVEDEKKRLDAFKEAVINKAKELEKQFGSINIFPELEVDFNTNKDQVFRNALRVLNDFPKNLLKLKVEPQLDIIPSSNIAEDIRVAAIRISNSFKGGFGGFKIPFNIAVQLAEEDTFKLSKEATDLFNKAQSRLSSLRPSVTFAGDSDFLKDYKANLQAALKAAEQFNATIAQTFAEGISGIAEGIGSALAGGENPFGTFANVIASGLQALGKQLIQVAVLAKVTKIALGSLFTNPALALAAGIGLIAAGAALKTALGKGIQGRERGGPVRAGQPYIVGEKRPEIFIPAVSGTIVPNTNMSSLQGVANNMAIQVFGRVAGNDILLSNSRTGRSNRRNG